MPSDREHSIAPVPPKQAAKAFSYVRFSTPEQSKGASLKRQEEMAGRWAERHGVELDTELTFRDEGVSAYGGLNVEKGALGAFLKAVETGQVPPGSFLLVESLDRISRQTARRALRTMEAIIDAGVTVVDINDGGREYTATAIDADPLLLMMMILRFTRAHEESQLKSSRLLDVRKRQREAFASHQELTKPYTRQLPAWLSWNEETKRIEPV